MRYTHADMEMYKTKLLEYSATGQESRFFS